MWCGRAVQCGAVLRGEARLMKCVDANANGLAKAWWRELQCTVARAVLACAGAVLG